MTPTWSKKRSRIVGSGLAVIMAVLVFGCLAGYLLKDRIMTPSVAQADSIERRNALPLTAFYNSPKGWQNTKPGDLLRKEDFDGYALPGGVKAVRILYHSRDAGGASNVSSAVILIPPGPPPPGGWRVIAWGHGTSGVARRCAPSAMKDVYYGEEGLFPMLRAGFAVVAADYHGLGTEGEHQYISKIGQAWDLINSIPAARAAVPELGKRWVADGHSQGGLAAWGVAELQMDIKDPDYLGAVAVSAPTHLGQIFDTPRSTKGAGFYVAWLAFGIHARYPQFQPREMLTEDALGRYEDATRGGCWYHGYAVYAGADASSVIKPNAVDNPWVRKFLSENTVANDPIHGPMLIIGGESDGTVPIEGMRESARKMCSKNMNVDFRSYPGRDHDPTMTFSTPDQLSWISDRFSNRKTSGNCTQTWK